MKKGQYQSPDSTRPSVGGKEGFDALFEHARRDAFTPAETERLWQSVITAGPGGADGGPEVPGGSTRGWTSGASLKVAAFVVAGGLVAAAFVARRSSPNEPVVVPSGAIQTAPTPTIEAPRGEGSPPVVSWEELPRAQHVGQSEPKPAPSPVVRSRAPSAQPEPAPAVEADPIASASPLPSDPGAAPAMTAPAPVSPASPSEGALLLRARQQLAADPASALALTDEAGRRFPDGALAPEREVLAIEALARLGRLPGARARFAAFAARYPQSPHLARLQSLLAP
jgi:hypothetical protein